MQAAPGVEEAGVAKHGHAGQDVYLEHIKSLKRCLDMSIFQQWTTEIKV